ncbi:MAG: hypothetical protein OXG36_10370 [Caldilineaceae bacterium]|nr:hypothetical protein [Caldilineaceae bacterium]
MANPYSNLSDTLAYDWSAVFRRAAQVNIAAAAEAVAKMQVDYLRNCKQFLAAWQPAAEVSRAVRIPQPLHGYTIRYWDKAPEVIYAVEYQRKVIMGRDTHCFLSNAGGTWLLRSGGVQAITRDRYPTR